METENSIIKRNLLLTVMLVLVLNMTLLSFKEKDIKATIDECISTVLCEGLI